MRLFSENENYKLYEGNMLDMLDVIEENSIDAIVTDPPYELGFMGKSWDKSGIAFQKETWEKCLRVLKPGGHLLAFGAPRNYHRLACAIEDAGFEIRDTIMWLYGSGFPKSMNIGLAIDKKNGVESIDTGVSSPNARPNSTKENTLYESGTVGKNFTIKKANNTWDGWGTSLKPSYEPIVIARKPCEGTCIDNVLKYGVGGLNIDECRIKTNGEAIAKNVAYSNEKQSDGWGTRKCVTELSSSVGRFPANTILTYDDTNYKEVCGGFPNTKGNITKEKGTFGFCFSDKKRDNKPMADGYDDECSAARYFYCAKASKRDREEGLGEEFEKKQNIFMATHNGTGGIQKGTERFATLPKHNFHPTVKPTNLMQYLIRLVSPNGAIILDPFNGSGSTGKAVMYENNDNNKNYKYIGIELDGDYLNISKARIEHAIQDKTPLEIKIKENKKTDDNKDKKENTYTQINLF